MSNKKCKTESTTTSPLSSSSPSSAAAPQNEPSSSSACSHSSTIPCIHLPRQCGIDGASVRVSLSFLRHLYFPRFYRYPPLRPNSEEDVVREEMLADDELKISHTFPRSLPSPHILDEYADRHDADYRAGLLSLFLHFDCQRALRRCEQVIIADCARVSRYVNDDDWLSEGSDEEEDEEEKGEDDDVERPSRVLDEHGKVRVFDQTFRYVMGHDGTRAWEWLSVTLRFGLKRAEETCIELMGADEEIGKGKGVDYEGLLKNLPASAILRVMNRLSENLCEVNGWYADCVD